MWFIQIVNAFCVQCALILLYVRAREPQRSEKINRIERFMKAMTTIFFSLSTITGIVASVFTLARHYNAHIHDLMISVKDIFEILHGKLLSKLVEYGFTLVIFHFVESLRCSWAHTYTHTSQIGNERKKKPKLHRQKTIFQHISNA